jgi:hypothetical protein
LTHSSCLRPMLHVAGRSLHPSFGNMQRSKATSNVGCCWHASKQKHNDKQTIFRRPLARSKTLCLDRRRWVPPARTGIAQSTAASTTHSSYGIYPDQKLRKPGNENQHESQCWLMKEQLVVGRFMKSTTPCRARSICMK